MYTFINNIKDGAIDGWKQYQILPSLTIAQAILESGWGLSELAQKSNNLFGIKAGSDWKGDSVPHETKEWQNGTYITTTARFRKYSSINESVLDHARFFHTPAWRELRYAHVIGETDYKKACYEVKKAGYATDIGYPVKLIKLIEEYKLYQYDEITKGGSSMKTVCLDAGHGGHDPGAINMGLGYTEKDLALKVVLATKQKLEDTGQIRVVLTRSSDVALSKVTSDDLSKRAWISNNANADAFVSIHMNSAGSNAAQGVETYSWSGADTPQLARAVYDAIVNAGLYNATRGTKTADYAVLRETNCIATLVEMAFINNNDDCLLVANNVDKFAKAISQGILNYLGIQANLSSKPTVKKQNTPPVNPYKRETEELVKMGITTGERPNDVLKRGELFALLYRTIKYVVNHK